MSTTFIGLKSAERLANPRQYLRNGDVTGKFRIRIEDGDFGELFQPGGTFEI